MALLYSEEVPQSADCDLGPLWRKCDGTGIDIFDHGTQQMFEDAEGSAAIPEKEAVVNFYFQSREYQFSATKIESGSLVINIDIVANAADGEKRQDILDEIEERIYYRIFSHASFTNATTGEKMGSFFKRIDQNRMSITTLDDSNFKGKYTIRTIRLSLSVRDCLEKPPCGDETLCIEWVLPNLC